MSGWLSCNDRYCPSCSRFTALFHSLIKSHPFMDGTKRTAFAATLYFLERLGYSRFSLLPEDEVIRFCLEIAEENIHRADNPALPPKTIAEIAAWFRRLLGVKD